MLRARRSCSARAPPPLWHTSGPVRTRRCGEIPERAGSAPRRGWETPQSHGEIRQRREGILLEQKYTVHVVHAGFRRVEGQQLFELCFGGHAVLQGDERLSAARFTNQRDLCCSEMGRELRDA